MTQESLLPRAVVALGVAALLLAAVPAATAGNAFLRVGLGPLPLVGGECEGAGVRCWCPTHNSLDRCADGERCTLYALVCATGLLP